LCPGQRYRTGIHKNLFFLLIPVIILQWQDLVCANISAPNQIKKGTDIKLEKIVDSTRLKNVFFFDLSLIT
jgi:hypothetical protein